MPYKPRIFSVFIKKSTVGYRAHCGGCKYVSNQHADKRKARQIAQNHSDSKHFNDIVSVVDA